MGLAILSRCFRIPPPRRSETRRYTSWTNGFRRQMPKHRHTNGDIKTSGAKAVIGKDGRRCSQSIFFTSRSLGLAEPVRCPPNEESQCERHLINARRATADRPETLHEFVGHTVSVSLSGPLPPCISVCVCVFLPVCLSVFLCFWLSVCLSLSVSVSVPSRHSTRRNRMPSKFSSGNKGSHCITRLWALLLLESRSKAHICQRLCLLKPLLREHFRAYCSRQTSYNYCIKTQCESLTEWYRLQGPWKLVHLVGTEEARELRKDGAGGAYHPVRDVRGFRGRHRRDLPPCVRLGLGFTAV